MKEPASTNPSAAPRVRLPEPDRVAPIRGGTLEIFGSPSAGSADEGASHTEPGFGPDANDRPEAQEPGGPAEAIRRTIERAYGVVDEHMRQGESAARRIAKQDYGPAAFAHDVQDAAARSLMFAAEVFEVWMQVGLGMSGAPNGTTSPFAAFLEMAGAGAGPNQSATQPRGSNAFADHAGATNGHAAGRSGARIAVCVEAAQPTELTVDLQDPSRAFALQPLYGPGGTIDSHAVEGYDPPRLRIRVPPGQAAGVYSGLAVDPTHNLPVGSVTLVVHPPLDATPGHGVGTTNAANRS